MATLYTLREVRDELSVLGQTPETIQAHYDVCPYDYPAGSAEYTLARSIAELVKAGYLTLNEADVRAYREQIADRVAAGKLP
jgi:hypothetical protein